VAGAIDLVTTFDPDVATTAIRVMAVDPHIARTHDRDGTRWRRWRWRDDDGRCRDLYRSVGVNEASGRDECEESYADQLHDGLWPRDQQTLDH
jgi:hypothetical protein